MKYLKIGGKTYYADANSRDIYIDPKKIKKLGVKKMPKEFKLIADMHAHIMRKGAVKSTSETRKLATLSKTNTLLQKILDHYVMSDNSKLSREMLNVYISEIKKSGGWSSRISLENLNPHLKRRGLKMKMVEKVFELKPTTWQKLKKDRIFRDYAELTRIKSKKKQTIIMFKYPKLLVDKLEKKIHNIKCIN